MVQLSRLAASLLVPAGVLAAPAAESKLQRRFDGNGFNNWSEGGSNIKCVNGPGGSFTADWNSQGGFVCGKGWNGQGDRTITYSGTYNATGPGYLAIYGWTRNPLIEYYIVESHADLAPNEPWTSKGTFTIDEGTYEVFTATRVEKPSIEGTRTFEQYWSVRQEKRVGGTVTTGKHFQQWAQLGMNLGTYDSVIVAVEGYTAQGGSGSAGSAAIEIE
ncbi:concanavalin A-like lectin/glucanase domain-containing protein [Corynascus novoguineensis]|uniref:Endo-1,4-beta-xylanase n=1 Tax=Corynascus novoguineensis TaxID=1126955 RepID=A0AAN7HLG3_9PEZI|nr:concanavalin A-like lectin/glucanase domain-containing protein [Corynascus novoguineensis]